MTTQTEKCSTHTHIHNTHSHTIAVFIHVLKLNTVHFQTFTRLRGELLQANITTDPREFTLNPDEDPRALVSRVYVSFSSFFFFCCFLLFFVVVVVVSPSFNDDGHNSLLTLHSDQ